MGSITAEAVAPTIGVKGLSYAFPDGSSGLRDVVLDLPPGSRTLLIGGMIDIDSIELEWFRFYTRCVSMCAHTGLMLFISS